MLLTQTTYVAVFGGVRTSIFYKFMAQLSLVTSFFLFSSCCQNPVISRPYTDTAEAVKGYSADRTRMRTSAPHTHRGFSTVRTHEGLCKTVTPNISEIWHQWWRQCWEKPSSWIGWPVSFLHLLPLALGEWEQGGQRCWRRIWRVTQRRKTKKMGLLVNWGRIKSRSSTLPDTPAKQSQWWCFWSWCLAQISDASRWRGGWPPGSAPHRWGTGTAAVQGRRWKWCKPPPSSSSRLPSTCPCSRTLTQTNRLAPWRLCYRWGSQSGSWRSPRTRAAVSTTVGSRQQRRRRTEGWGGGRRWQWKRWRLKSWWEPQSTDRSGGRGRNWTRKESQGSHWVKTYLLREACGRGEQEEVKRYI